MQLYALELHSWFAVFTFSALVICWLPQALLSTTPSAANQQPGAPVNSTPSEAPAAVSSGLLEHAAADKQTTSQPLEQTRADETHAEELFTIYMGDDDDESDDDGVLHTANQTIAVAEDQQTGVADEQAGVADEQAMVPGDSTAGHSDDVGSTSGEESDVSGSIIPETAPQVCVQMCCTMSDASSSAV